MNDALSAAMRTYLAEALELCGELQTHPASQKLTESTIQTVGRLVESITAGDAETAAATGIALGGAITTLKQFARVSGVAVKDDLTPRHVKRARAKTQQRRQAYAAALPKFFGKKAKSQGAAARALGVSARTIKRAIRDNKS